MPVRVWSPTQVLSYRTCPRQWLLRYRLADPVTRVSMAAEAPLVMLLGTVAHLGLQAAYETAKAGFGRFGEQSMSVFAEAAIDAIRAACVDFDIDELPEATQVEDEVFAVLDRLPRPRASAILGVELKLDDEIDGVPFTNVIDLVLQTGSSSIHIRDWKRRNVKALPLTVDLPDHPQLCSYRSAIARHFPWARTVTGGLYSLISNREVSAELPMARAQRVMAGEVATTRKAESDTLCTPTPNGENCQKCPVKAACPVWTDSPLP
jgi:hypothetical protein